MRMITWQDQATRFTNRVAGVAVENGRVLLHRAETDNFWVLPGGRAELMETAADTLRREMREELEINVEVVRLLWLVENFFHYEGMDHHEIGLYFLMQTPETWPFHDHVGPFRGYEGTIPLVFQWFPLVEAAALKVYPNFLPSGLQQLPVGVQHIVHRDE